MMLGKIRASHEFALKFAGKDESGRSKFRVRAGKIDDIIPDGCISSDSPAVIVVDPDWLQEFGEADTEAQLPPQHGFLRRLRDCIEGPLELPGGPTKPPVFGEPVHYFYFVWAEVSYIQSGPRFAETQSAEIKHGLNPRSEGWEWFPRQPPFMAEIVDGMRQPSDGICFVMLAIIFKIVPEPSLPAVLRVWPCALGDVILNGPVAHVENSAPPATANGQTIATEYRAARSLIPCHAPLPTTVDPSTGESNQPDILPLPKLQMEDPT